MSMGRTIHFVLATIALVCATLGANIRPLAAEDADVKVAREIHEQEEALKKIESDILDKERARDSNIRDQATAKGDALKKLKRAHATIANELNALRRKERKARLTIDAKIGELRTSARLALDARVCDAEKFLAQGKEADAKQALQDAHAKVQPWEQGLLRWRMYIHMQSELKQPATEERKARVRTELARLELGLARLGDESRRVADESTVIAALEGKKIEHAEWKTVLAALSELQKKLTQRKDEIVAAVRKLQERKTEIEKYLD